LPTISESLAKTDGKGFAGFVRGVLITGSSAELVQSKILKENDRKMG